MGIGFCLEEKVVFLRRRHFGCVGNATYGDFGCVGNATYGDFGCVNNATYGDFGCVGNATYGTLVALATQHTELATNEQNKT